VTPIVYTLTFFLFFSVVVVAQQEKPTAPTKPVTVKGRVLDPQDPECCDGPETKQGQSSARFSFKTADGKVYKFLATDAATAMFTDPQVRSRELHIAAIAHSNDQLEVIRVYSVREGKLYDLYYFCDVCSITAYAPGACPCCYGKFELKETPATKP
jgi:hypothetical protein